MAYLTVPNIQILKLLDKSSMLNFLRAEFMELHCWLHFNF